MRLLSPMWIAADDLGARADHDVVAERGVALLALEAGAAQAHALVELTFLPTSAVSPMTTPMP